MPELNGLLNPQLAYDSRVLGPADSLDKAQSPRWLSTLRVTSLNNQSTNFPAAHPSVCFSIISRIESFVILLTLGTGLLTYNEHRLDLTSGLTASDGDTSVAITDHKYQKSMQAIVSTYLLFGGIF
ncbi:hypothetical protein TNIN_138711 [Trichonephila inaurata madagascariensis]|uniref:Uncharacterized protein n=1 Tax=Trichonephila inaurata madagascariensis TaxID=2747483 RepID=A0A8X7CNQ2_9ARAC|nr:hypothetical protein TNIN_138711 [Trichonephila inaurata madagascariensis]